MFEPTHLLFHPAQHPQSAPIYVGVDFSLAVHIIFLGADGVQVGLHLVLVALVQQVLQIVRGELGGSTLLGEELALVLGLDVLGVVLVVRRRLRRWFHQSLSYCLLFE